MPEPFIHHGVDDMRETVRGWQRDGLKVGIVPTMGALHAGHLSLIEEISKVAERIIVSIFVNPTQFAAHEDLDKYPRTEDSDLEKLSVTKTDLVYMPTAREMYPDGFETSVSIGGPAAGLESDERPHFFGGVSLIVLKLFMQSLANVAIFGEKDYQQLLVIRQMVRDLNLPIEVMAGPIIREADGLAMSSRNTYLSPEERSIAGKLNIIMKELANSTQPHDIAEAKAQAALLDAGFSSVDYATIRDADTLMPPNKETIARRALIVARLGTIRLLDNMEAL